MGTDRNCSSERFGVKAESGIEVFIEVGIAGDDEALRLIRRVDKPSCGVVGKTEEDTTSSSL